MSVDPSLLNGQVTDSEAILCMLRADLLPHAIRQMNEELLPFQFALYKDDRIPTNQRNLTDVRTRMGVLLEYELAKAINHVLGEGVTRQVILTYVLANRFPDLAFRTRTGGIGVRFEVKAIETIAEEKSANFDTLIKDIRKGTDFVIAMLWEWREHGSHPLRHPLIADVFILDAYQLAQMRDTYWLNRPPTNPGDARQGFDLCFGVNCRESQYNREEGNYGKLMRIFESGYAKHLTEDVRRGSSLKEYDRFQKTTIRLGLERIGCQIAEDFFSNPGAGKVEVFSTGLPLVLAASEGEKKLLIVGDASLPKKTDVVGLMVAHGIQQAMLLNGKFDWKVRDLDWSELASGNKPASAMEWVASMR